MKIKIFTIFVCMILFSSTTTLALTHFSKNKKETKNQFSDTTPVPLPTSSRWMKTFGGTGDDCGYSVQQTSDSGYIITGNTNSFGAGYDDIWLIKTDSNGNKIWDKTFGGTKDDHGYYVQQTTDDGYIIIGWTESYGYYRNIWLIKTDNNGTKIWDKTFGITSFSMGFTVQQTSDHGYILVGQILSNISFMDILLIKTDDNGNEEWNRTFGGINGEQGFSVQQTTDGGYIITGNTGSFGVGRNDAWLIKTDSHGIELWDNTFGGTDHDYGILGQQTFDGGYIIIGSTWSFSAGKEDVWLIKTDSYGNKMWDKTYGGTSADWGASVQQTVDGGYIIIGSTWSFGVGAVNIWLIKTDNNGNKLWDRTFGGLIGGYGESVQQTNDDGYIITGYTSSDNNKNVLLIKTNSQGQLKTILSDNLLKRMFQRFANAFLLLRQLLQ
jgi:hypothetical protein